MLKNIIYTHDSVYAYADSCVEERAKEYLESSDDITKTSNDLFILAIRTLVMEGVFPRENVCIHYQGEAIHITEDGSLDHYPKGFCDDEEKLYARLFAQKRLLDEGKSSKDITKIS